MKLTKLSDLLNPEFFTPKKGMPVNEILDLAEQVSAHISTKNSTHMIKKRVTKALLEFADSKLYPDISNFGTMENYSISLKGKHKNYTPSNEDCEMYCLIKIFLFICMQYYRYNPINNQKLSKELLEQHNITLVKNIIPKKRVNSRIYKSLKIAQEKADISVEQDTIRLYLRLGILISLGCLPINFRYNTKSKKKIYDLLSIVIKDNFIDHDNEIGELIPENLLKFLNEWDLIHTEQKYILENF